jgi:hypothetical protein
MTKRWLGFVSLLALGQALAAGCIVVDGDAESSTGGATPGGESTGGDATGGDDNTAGDYQSTGGVAGTTVSEGGTAGTLVSDGGGAGALVTEGGTAGTPVSDGGAAGTLASEGGAGGSAGAGSTVVNQSDLVTLSDGVFVEADAPASDSEYDGDQITSLSGPDAVTNGGTFTLTATITEATGDHDFLVVIDDDNGHFTTRKTAGEGGTFNIEFTLNPDLDLATVTASVAPVDADGDVGDYASVTLPVVQSGTGDAKVTLSFDQDTDLDLHVIEPDGTRIYWSANSPSGGELDLDSNPACDIDGVNIENIFWPIDSAPAGEYVVEVQYYEACLTGTVNYTVTISVGDDVQTLRGSVDETDMLPSDGNPEVDSLIEVARFTID